jgi:hypothetical protein
VVVAERTAQVVAVRVDIVHLCLVNHLVVVLLLKTFCNFLLEHTQLLLVLVVLLVMVAAVALEAAAVFLVVH